jgi:hypothetical protein
MGSLYMKALNRQLALLVMAASLALGSDQDRGYGDLRGLIDRTQSDLRSASGLEHGNKQRDRYHNAQDNLSKLDRKLSKGKFDKGALDHSIDDVKAILDHNTLQASSRDLLRRDLTDLKVARASR